MSCGAMLALLPGTDCPPPSRCPESIPAEGTRAGARGAAGGLRPAGARAGDQLGDAARAGAQRRRGGDPTRPGLLRRAEHAHRRRRAGPRVRPAPTCAPSRATWTPSSPTRPAAGRGCTSTGCCSPGSRKPRRPPRCGKRAVDVSVFLAQLGLRAPAAACRQPLKVAYHDACHLAHAQGVTDPPRRLLRAIPNLTLLEIPEGEICCGSAGHLQHRAAGDRRRRWARARPRTS